MRSQVYQAAFLSACAVCSSLFAQAEVTGWGNLRGIRVGDQLVPVTTAVGVYNQDFTNVVLSQREGPIRTNRYVRTANTVTVGENLSYNANGGRENGAGNGGNPQPAATPQPAPAGAGPGPQAATNPATNPVARGNAAGNAGGAGGGRGNRGPAGGFSYTLAYTDFAPGVCDVAIDLTANVDQSIGGVYYFVNLPSKVFTDAKAELIGSSTPVNGPTSLTTADEQGRFLKATCSGIRISGNSGTHVELNFPQPLEVVVQNAKGRDASGLQVYFPIATGSMTAAQTAASKFTIKTSTEIDTRPVTVAIDTSKTGRTWDGVGGNYRIQNQRLDPLHIQYILDNMRVAYGRVAMPWNAWQPDENSPPPMLAGPTTAPAANGAGGGGGGAMNSVASAMGIAEKLTKSNVPIMIAVWSPPTWATLPNNGGGRGGGMRLDPAKYPQIAKSIGSYLLYLKEHHGAEPTLFSFNESNIGINVRQSPQDHADMNKILGAHFQSIGLKTRMLLGDTGDVPPYSFIEASMNDPEAVKYIGAVSFHSWRGATDEQYKKWADAAAKLNVPLFDAEGGNDAQASSYSNIFREAWYSLDEAAEYVRIMNLCQPQAILEWQFTENYSILSTDANGDLHPTQRFFNLKQMNLTPAGSAWLATQSNSDSVYAASYVDKDKTGYSVHLVNNGAARRVTLTGLPQSVKKLNVFITDKDRGMAAAEPVTVNNGTAEFQLGGQLYATLVSDSK